MSLSLCLAAAARSVGTGVIGIFSPRRCTQAASTLSPRWSKSTVCGERLRDAALSCLTPCGNLRPAGDGLLSAGLALSSTVGRTADRERPGERPRALSMAVRGRPKWLGGGGSGDSSRLPQVDAAAPVDTEPLQYVECSCAAFLAAPHFLQISFLPNCHSSVWHCPHFQSPSR
jgi:hypothetical protein